MNKPDQHQSSACCRHSPAASIDPGEHAPHLPTANARTPVPAANTKAPLPADVEAPAGAIYTCPMHPEVRQIGPGTLSQVRHGAGTLDADRDDG
jgi:hypothetical protein